MQKFQLIEKFVTKSKELLAAYNKDKENLKLNNLTKSKNYLF